MTFLKPKTSAHKAMATQARRFLLHLRRTTSHYPNSCALSQKLVDRGPFSPSAALWRTHFYSSVPAKADLGKVGKPAISMPNPESDPEKNKKLKTLARILGQDDPDAGLDPDMYLLKVLKKQLKKADQSVQKYKVEIKGAFDPFEIVPTEGTSDLTLRRQTEEEEIIVKCILELEEPDDEEYLAEDNEDELNIIQHLKMNIEFRKASLGDTARFQLLCHYMTQSITIEEIVYLDKSAYIENDYPYIGPLFSHLNPRMQQCFYDLIKSRGIDTSLADLALDHLSSKYQEEYLSWVRNIRGFLKRKREIEAPPKSVSE